MSTVPEPPEVPDSQIGVGEIELRYDDLCQDGRMRIAGVWPPLGRILWTQMPVARALARLGARGIRNVRRRRCAPSGCGAFEPSRRNTLFRPRPPALHAAAVACALIDFDRERDQAPTKQACQSSE